MKKKKDGHAFNLKEKLKKRILPGMFIISFLCTGLFTVKGESVNPKDSVVFKTRQMMVEQVFDAITQQLKYGVFYSENEIDVKKIIQLPRLTLSLTEVLDLILKKDFTYILEKKNIIISPAKQTAKERMISGIVKDEQGNPLPGVTVVVKGTVVGVSTDTKGMFRLSFPNQTKDGKLLFSFIGMETVEIPLNKDYFEITMKESVNEINEVTVVSTGYQTIDRRKITSAVTTLKADDVIIPGFNTIDQMLEGHVPGMIFMQNSGQVGVAPRLRIRGTSTILGNQEPLWVIDGIVQENPINVDPSEINNLDFVNLLGNAVSGLNPEDIDQIDVLKDASATAIYGTRAANGVIVITTKKGKLGPPTVSYSLAGVYTQRPRYSDRSVNMMNSKERIALSREIMEKRVPIPIFTWVGYEATMRDYYNDQISHEEMQKQVSFYENVNTDWFKLLTNDSFSHKHTLSLSGGNSQIRYYTSLAFSDARGTTRGENNKLYSATVNLTSTLNRFNVQLGINANRQEKKYTPTETALMNYAYNTSRAVPAYNEDGSLWFYERTGSTLLSKVLEFNILNEMENCSQKIKINSISLNTTINYRILDPLKVGVTLSYTLNDSYQDTYYDENSYYCQKLKYYRKGGEDSYLPIGGELQQKYTQRDKYLFRLQVDYNQFMDHNNDHLITASAGGEISSNHYTGLDLITRGYLRERGEKVATINLSDYPNYAAWLSTTEAAKGIHTNQMTNIVSGYITTSYSYRNRYIFNANMRLDASNKFGSKSNDKLTPIWSVSGRWNMKEDLFENTKWINHLSVLASWGYQGNMLDSESSKLIIKKEDYNTIMGAYKSSIQSFPNPDLRWEKTSSSNITLEFNLLRNQVSGNISYFQKKTNDTFLSKDISDINGRHTYVVNKGTVINKGLEMSFMFTPLNFTSAAHPHAFRWSISPQLGQVTNKLTVKNQGKDKATNQNFSYNDYLNGNVEISGRPLNTFYSYKFTGLDPKDGRPTFANIDEKNDQERYKTMSKEEVFDAVLTHSGKRVPDLQGSITNSFSYRRFSLSVNMTFSLGYKVRLLKMYPDLSGYSIAPSPEKNIRKEWKQRWQHPGDETRTTIPGIISGNELTNTFAPWWKTKPYKFAESIWDMYDNSDLRVVNGDFLKLNSLSLRYNIPERFAGKIYMKSAYVGFSCTNLFMICDKNLRGQDPATQSGTAPQINMSLRPTYSLNLNVSF